MSSSGRVAWLAAAGVLTVGTFILSAVPGDRLPPGVLFHWDLALHAVEYGVLAAVCWGLLTYGLRLRGSVALAVLVVLYAAVVGGLNELLQAWIPGRYPTWADAAANVVGAVLAIGIIKMKRKQSAGIQGG